MIIETMLLGISGLAYLSYDEQERKRKEKEREEEKKNKGKG